MATTDIAKAIPEQSQPQAKKSRMSAKERQEMKWGLFFLSPWIFGFLVFTLLPLLATFAFAFTNYNPVRPDATEFVGFKNFATMTTDATVLDSLLVTIRYAALAIPVTFILGIGLASLVNSDKLVGREGFRTLFYMPSMIPVVAAGVIWAGVANTQTGWINVSLEAMGIPGPDWLNSPVWIYPLLVLIGLWGTGNLMLTLMAGMQGVPTEVYEAAVIDGANGWQRFRNITIPLISPVIFYNLTLMLIGAFKYFDLAYVLKDGTGEPQGATLFYALNFYKNSFEYNLMGYGSALAWVLFLIVLILTIILFATSGRWVYYAGDGRS
ncbi:MAG: sugar ABC transporter permease [Anaerolineales bacterium]|nr:sugar ABC transporter permease [Anaerolineales bacterium]